MSGRGGRNNQGNGRFGRGGRARGRSNNHNSSNKSSNNKSTARKTLADHVYSIGSAKQASDYSVITQFIINHIRKSFEFGDDIGDALENWKDVELDPPKLKPVSKYSENKELEERQNEYLFKAQIAAFVAREEKYIANKGKGYALIYGQCNKPLQHKLQARKDFESEIKGDLIKLLDAISEHSMSYVENKYPFSTALDAIKNYINLKQIEDESLVDYTRRFKSAKKIMETQIGGELELPKLAKIDPRWMEVNDPGEWVISNEAECRARAYKRFTTFLYLENADRTKYGTLLSGLATQYSLGQNQYPQTVEEATNVLSNHKFDQAYYDNKKKRSQGSNNSNSGQQRQTDRQRQNEGDDTPLSFAQMENRCY